MKLEVIGLADTHLKESNIKVVTGIFEQAADRAIEHGLKEVWHLGDIFNSRKGQTIDVLNAFLSILDSYIDRGLRLRVIPGNHDKTDYNSWESFLDVFNPHQGILLHSRGAIVLGDKWESIFMPYITPDKYIEQLDALYTQLNPRKNRKVVLFTHIDLNGAVMNSGSVIETKITRDLFKRFTKVLVGHYHDPATYANIHYVGASLQHSFGENQNKGMWGLDSDMEIKLLPLTYPKFVTYQIDTQNYKPVEIEQILKIKQEDSNSRIRVELVGTEASNKSFNKEMFINEGIVLKGTERAITDDEQVIISSTPTMLDDASLMSHFVEFCKVKELDEPTIKIGQTYLQKALTHV